MSSLPEAWGTNTCDSTSRSFYFLVMNKAIFKHVVCFLCVFPSDNYIDNLPIDIQRYSFNSLAFIFQLLILFLFILVCFTGMFEDDIKCILKLAFMGNGQQGGIV